MAKTKRNYIQKKGFGENPQALRSQAQKAIALVKKGQVKEAEIMLQSLQKKYPDNLDILGGFLDVYQLTENWLNYIKYAQIILKLKPEQKDIFYNLGYSYLLSGNQQLALDTLKEFSKKYPDYFKINLVQETIQTLENWSEEEFQNLGIADHPQRVELKRLHEHLVITGSRSEYEQSCQYFQQISALDPTFIPAFNNLGIAAWNTGHIDDAIAIVEKALAIDPHNVHALSNSTRFLFLNGQLEAAQKRAEQLKALPLTNFHPHFIVKRVEALAYLADDAAIIDLLHQVEQANQLPAMDSLFYHLTAVSLFHTGQVAKAQQLWESVKTKDDFIHPSVQQNLQDLEQPLGSRHAPWSYDLFSWITPPIFEEFRNILSSQDDLANAEIQTAIQDYLAQYSYLIPLFPLILKRGSVDARQFTIGLCKLSKQPELLEILSEFTLSPYGTDALRFDLAQTLIRLGHWSPGLKTLYQRGKPTKMLMFGLEIHDDPIEHPSSQVKQWLAKGVQCLKNEQLQAAENYFKKALKQEPHANDLRFNLAMSYQMQERFEEAETLLQEIWTQDPTYGFAGVGLASLYLKQDQVTKAVDLLEIVVQLPRLHYTAFSFLCDTQLQCLVAQKHYDAMASWLAIWRQVDSEHPNINIWQKKLDLLQSLQDS